jgi:anti-sigma factor RsiW
MKCKEIQEIISTDFVDGLLSDKQKGDIESHLSECQECRNYHEKLVFSAILPFRNAQSYKPPYYAWQKIKNRILEEDKIEFFPQLFNSLPRWINTLAVVSMLLGMLFAGGFAGKNISGNTSYIEKAEESVVELSALKDIPNEMIENINNEIAGG